MWGRDLVGGTVREGEGDDMIRVLGAQEPHLRRSLRSQSGGGGAAGQPAERHLRLFLQASCPGDT